MPVQPGEFWVADIPFTHGTASKRRPILVLWLDGADLVAAAVTSAAPRSATDVALADWQSSALRVASTVRLSRLDCLEQSLLIARNGAVSSNDAQAIKQVWASQIMPRF
ncbi:MAG TPA: type II toxin-antitoxin system PemK/MazF family toxin [Isosphaeraceae bacterium]|nr:type II toxin-antitoxin system PemK/MazF family toxin [Isosphaeraceae bacterium]